MSANKSPADQLVDLIQSAHLTKFTSAEEGLLDDIGSREDGILFNSARLAVRGRSTRLIVSAPFKVNDDLIKFYTPAEPESCCVLSLDVIEGVYFTE
ncbi:hypothetical protein [Pseudomonas aeruginosa]|jgi:hypothetical protein|uniref:hypothetical protein n=1 Tax=Pseudomonas aeruginosa TaxID=287 RepID=UPI000B5A4E5C|nr:hypothetical protein [Pseudomonas aeruginosa]ASJ88631.1 hypothetical protein PSA83_06505 [Pseudomonas aeruginosa]ELN4740425.1 hypothetical protein [Escherichia coli]